MQHLFLAGALFLALLALVSIAVGACLSIARYLMLDGADDDRDERAIAGDGRMSPSALQRRHARNH
jgi:hypothetical protein